MKLTLDKGMVEEVEKNLRPPMLIAITIPVEVDGQASSVGVYVCCSPFMLPGEERGKLQLVKEVARRLALEP